MDMIAFTSASRSRSISDMISDWMRFTSESSIRPIIPKSIHTGFPWLTMMFPWCGSPWNVPTSSTWWM